MKPRLLVLGGEPLFRSFFDAARRRRLGRRFAWQRIEAARITPVVRRALETAEALVTTWDSPRFGEDLPGLAPRLRAIGHCGGEVKGRFARPLFDQFVITNAPDPMAGPVAELALAFTLQAVRRIDEHRRALAREGWKAWARIHTRGTASETLAGRTVGLLGFGRIARAYATRLRPFGARLLVHDPFVSAAAVRRARARRVPLQALLRGSEVLVVAAALTERTRGLLDRRRLAWLPDGCTVVNVARGGLVDLAALTREVRRGRLRCALDVTDPQEPLPARHPLLRTAGALVTPHIGAASAEVRLQMADRVLDDLERTFDGRRPRRRVTVPMLDRMT